MTPPSARNQSALECSGVSVFVGQSGEERAILRDVDLDIQAGELVALIGPSGAGKTTLLRLLGSSLWADRGSVRVLGAEPSRLGARALRQHRKRVGLLRQQDNLVMPLRVAHNVQMGRLGDWSTLRSLWNLVWPRQLDRARAALGKVELEDRLWALPEELSGGERQRVAIARLIVQQPQVLLADEPVSALDVRLGGEVIDLLMDVAREQEAALLVSLHALGFIRRGFDRVVAMRDGQICWQGKPEELDQETLREIYGAEFEDLE